LRARRVLFKKPTAALESAINKGRIAAVTARDFIEMQAACRSSLTDK
jgi:hypothetical protein